MTPHSDAGQDDQAASPAGTEAAGGYPANGASATDLIALVDDEAPPSAPSATWRVLIVDDDPDVHSTTEFALRDTLILGRPLQFLHAYSGAEAEAVLAHSANLAVVLLDVVMEHQDAGLRLVQTIRERYGMSETRIILRTGQPGYAPEIEAIRDYDINDYKTKSDLTRNKLYTTLTAAIRSYDQIRTISTARRGLDLIVRACGELLALSGLRDFAAGVVTQIAALLGLEPEGVVCAQDERTQPHGARELRVIAAAGRYARLINLPLSELPEPDMRAQLEHCLSTCHHVFEAQSATLFFRGRSDHHMAAYLRCSHPPATLDHSLLEIFCTNIAIGLDNALLFAQILDSAYRDPLTGLPNRLALIGELDTLLRAPQAASHTLALLDLDHFAELNDAFGHAFGDQLLCATAQRLDDARASDTRLARVAGDTFALLGPSPRLLPARLAALFREPFVLEGQELLLSVTLGLAHLSDIEGGGADALKDATIALKRAKLRHRGECSFFTREMRVEARERVRLLQALRAAFEHAELFLMYQPQVTLPTGRVVGVEALLRWRGDDGQLIPPDRFIPLAEHSGLILALGEWVLRQACHQQAALARAGHPALRMAINVSVSQFRHPRFLEVLHGALADSGADRDQIELEITESMAMEEADFLLHTLDDIKALGVTIAVDDFGTGFSSLAYLQRLRVDRLKIDRAFVREIGSGGRGTTIPGMVIRLGAELGLTVIAEGVELAEQAQALNALGCAEAQGYYFGHPMEPDALLAWLASQALQP